jgi:hypothetical protein
MLNEIDRCNPWSAPDRFPDLRQGTSSDFYFLNAWCLKADAESNRAIGEGRDGPRWRGPGAISGTYNYYGPMLGWVQERLVAVRLLLAELENLSKDAR